MNETCPTCGTVHVGFTPRPEQKRSFWNCRSCNANLTTEVSSGISHPTDVLDLYAHWRTMRDLCLFSRDPFIYRIMHLCEDADDLHDYYKRLKELP